MMHGLAARGKAAGWVGAIPLLPVLVELRKLATGGLASSRASLALSRQLKGGADGLGRQ